MKEIITQAKKPCPVHPTSMVYKIAALIHETGAPIAYETALAQFNPGRYRTVKIQSINDALGLGWLNLDAGNLSLGRLAERWFHAPSAAEIASSRTLPPYRASIFGAPPLSKQYIPSTVARRHDAAPARDIFYKTSQTVAEPKVCGVVIV